MTYVEWLRVRNTLRITLYVFAALLVCVGIFRIWVAVELKSHDVSSRISAIENDPHSHVTHTTLPSGAKRTIIDNTQNGDHIVIDDYGYQGKHIELLEPKETSTSHDDNVVIGSVNFRSRLTPHGRLTTIDTGEPEDFSYYAAIATLVALIIATILGAPFARENDGHLEIAMTKPISRETLALATVGVDLLGILGAWVMTVVFLIVAHAFFEAPHPMFGPRTGLVILLGFVTLAAWYGMLCAATSSLKRAYGVMLGLSWPIAAGIVGAAKANLGATSLGQFIHYVVTPLSWIDPFNYLNLGPALADDPDPGAVAVLWQHDLPALLILAIVYIALTVWQWRRVEA